jgi:putative DNA primase/helicase
MRGHEHGDWVRRAKSVPIEREIERRSIKLRRVGAELVGPCPKCGGDNRFAVNVKKQLFNCRGCGIKGDVIQLVEHLDGIDFNTACAALTGQPPPKANGEGNDAGAVDSAKKVIVATFPYADENGNVLFAVDRIEFQKPDGSFVLKNGKHDKVFRQRRPDPDYPGKWVHNVAGVRVVPYRLPELQKSVAARHPILIVEGEAKADLLWSWNMPATCCAGGAEKWRSEHSEYLRDADSVLLPDNDEPGFKHAAKVGAMLLGIAKRVRLLVLPDLPPKGDIRDWADAGGAREQLDTLLEQAQDYCRPLALKANTADDGNEKEDTHNDSDRESGLSLLPPPSQPMAVARTFVDECLHSGLLTLRYWRGGWWMWKTTHWIEVEDSAVRSVLYRYTEKAFYFEAKMPRQWAPNRRKISDLIDALTGICLLPNEIDQPSWLDGDAATDSTVVSVKNGLLDVNRRRLLRHTPQFFNQTSVPFDYDPNASEPRRWLDFLAELWADQPDAIDVLGEWFGYVISGRTDLHKIMLMVGPTRGGKGAIARVLTSMVGRKNFAGPTLNSLGGEFGLAPLIGKPLAVISDARFAGKDASVVVERLLSISGEDALTINRKYQVQWTGKLPTRLQVLSNELPKLGDASTAIVGRIVLLLMTRSWLGREDHTLEPALHTELTGILNWALDGLQRLTVTNDNCFTRLTSTDEAITTMRDLASPVAAFVREQCEIAANCEISVNALYAAYKTWAEDNGHSKKSKQTFGRDLRAAIPSISMKRPRDRADRHRIYTGIDMRRG